MFNDSRNGSDPVNGLIAKYLSSENSDSPLTREELLERHPELADSLQAFFDSHDRMKIVTEFQPSPASNHPGRARNHENYSDADSEREFAVAEPFTSPDLPADRKIRYFGNYELMEEVARGGMGVVYKARQTSLNRVVALKMILAGQLACEEEVERFRAEAKAAATLEHPGIIPIYEVGSHNDYHYFSMVFVEGQSLAEMIHEGPLVPRVAAIYVQKIAEAMAFAHSKGVIHRDLKPANILIDVNNEPKITDFGLAKKIEGDGNLTVTGQILGTPSFMPPEQARGIAGQITASVDVYALGAILYALITGRPPFQAASHLETLRQVLEEEPVSPRSLNPQVPQDLETICLKCLRKDVRQRYPGAQELADELERYLAGKPILARPISSASRVWRWCERNPLVASLASLVVLALLLGITVSAYFAVSEFEARQQAESQAISESLAKQAALELAWDANLKEARSWQWSRRSGQRFDALDALERASQLRPSVELRNEAIASLALVDIKPVKEWADFPQDSESIAFDRLVTRYARGDMQGNVVVKKVENGEELVRLPGFGSRTEWKILKFSHDGRLLAVGYRNVECRVWDLNTQEVILTIPYGQFEAGFDFSPDDKYVAFAESSGNVHIYEIATGQECVNFPSEIGAFFLAYSPDGKRLAVCGSHHSCRIRLFDAEQGTLLKELQQPGQVFRAAWHPKGRMLATNCPPLGIQVWDTETGEVVQTMQDSSITDAIYYHPAGDLVVSGGWDGYTRVWDAFTGSLLLTVSGSPRHFDPAGNQLAGLRGGDQLVLWEFAYDDECRRLPVHNTHGITIQHEGTMFGAFGRNGVTFFDFESGQVMGEADTGDTIGSVFSPDDKYLFTSGSAGLLQWNLRPPMSSSGMTWSLDSRRDLWNSRDIKDTAISLNGERVVATSLPGLGVVVDLSNNEQRVFEHQSGMHNVAMSPDGQFIITGAWRAKSGTIVWDATTGEVVHKFEHSHPSSLPRISPDGSLLIIGSNVSYKFYEMGTWREIHEIERSQLANVYGSICFTRDGRLLALNHSRAEIRLYDGKTFELLAAIVNRQQTALGFSPDGSKLIVSERDHGKERLRIWDLNAVQKRLRELGLDWEYSSPTSGPQLTTHVPLAR